MLSENIEQVQAIEMNLKTFKALKASRNKWARLAKTTEKKALDSNDDAFPGVDNCALCRLYNNWSVIYAESCVGCPIAEVVGVKGCNFTPYMNFGPLTAGKEAQNEAAVEFVRIFDEMIAKSKAIPKATTKVIWLEKENA